MIEQVSATEFKLTKGAQKMTLRLDGGSWWVTTHNPCTRAYRGRLGSLRRFDTLSEVEGHYKSWRGISALHAATIAASQKETMKAQEQAILIAADSIEQLRKIDVFRVLDSCPRVSHHNPNGCAKAVALYIIKQRPELRQEVIDCMTEMGCELRIPVAANAIA
jgi:hypothetical protein